MNLRSHANWNVSCKILQSSAIVWHGCFVQHVGLGGRNFSFLRRLPLGGQVGAICERRQCRSMIKRVCYDEHLDTRWITIIQTYPPQVCWSLRLELPARLSLLWAPGILNFALKQLRLWSSGRLWQGHFCTSGFFVLAWTSVSLPPHSNQSTQNTHTPSVETNHVGFLTT